MNTMKNAVIASICLLAMAAAAASFRLSVGFGAQVTATTNVAQVAVSEVNMADVYAQSLSVYNAGTSTAFCAIDSGTSAFRAMVTNGTAVRVPSEMVYTFTGTRIKSVCIATTNGQAVVYIAAH
jgi:hypothetical protein